MFNFPMANFIGQRIAAMPRSRENILLLMMGALSALALPPIHALAILWLTIPAWLLLLEKAPTGKRAFWMGWLFGFGYFIAGLYWIAAALFVDIARYWWVLPFAACGLPVLMAAYWGLAAVAWHYLAWRGWPKLLAFAVIFTLCEYVRGWMFSGFPWNYIGYAWTAFLPLLQSVSLFGVIGLSFLTFLLAALPYLYITRPHPDDHHRNLFAGVILGVVISLSAWGFGRISHPPALADKPIIVRIVQPNIAQEAKWSEAQQKQHRDALWRLSKSTTDQTATTDTKKAGLVPGLIVWPETAIGLIDTVDVREWQQQLHDNIAPDTLLATGVLEGDVTPANEPTFYNRMDVFNASGEPLAMYAKSHLVPFGEYLPFQKYWPVTPPAVTAGTFSAGDGVQTFHVKNLPPFSALVCYEVIFPDQIANNKDRPQFLLNVTNDAWYGRTSGPYQHLAITQTRAVEQGLPMIRAANTGISAMIDGQGRIVSSLGLGETGRIDTVLPRALHTTLFAKYGTESWLLLLGLSFVIAYFGQTAQQKRPTVA